MHSHSSTTSLDSGLLISDAVLPTKLFGLEGFQDLDGLGDDNQFRLLSVRDDLWKGW
jgi:hypothetical protein